jgi:hypothetical protein
MNEYLNTIIITCNDYTFEELLPILEYLRYCGAVGHSARFGIDDKKFFFDGDGASRFTEFIVNGKSYDVEHLRDWLNRVETELATYKPKSHNGSTTYEQSAGNDIAPRNDDK